MICVKASYSVLNRPRKLLKLNCMERKNIFCILLLSFDMSKLTAVIGDTLISERLDMPQFYIFDVPLSLKNRLTLITSVLDVLDKQI